MLADEVLSFEWIEVFRQILWGRIIFEVSLPFGLRRHFFCNIIYIYYYCLLIFVANKGLMTFLFDEIPEYVMPCIRHISAVHYPICFP